MTGAATTLPRGPDRVATPPSRRAANRRVGIRREAVRWLRSGVAVGGAAVVLVFILLAILAPLVASSPNVSEPTLRLKPPSFDHPFGTDHLGRDVFSRVLFGARVSLAVGLVVVVTCGLVGGVVGLVAGLYPRLDNPLMRLADSLMAFPGILLAIALMGSLGPGSSQLVIALSVVYAPRVARVVRATVLVVREQTFVEAARALGASDTRIAVRHLAPNCWGPLNVQCTFIFAYAILAEASLSFLGVGTPPDVPTWGSILNEGRNYLYQAPWITFFPGSAIMLAVLGLNLLGDGLRDLLDPRLRTAE